MQHQKSSFSLMIKTGLTEIQRDARTFFFTLLFPFFFLGMFAAMNFAIPPTEDMGLSFLEYLFPGILVFALVSIGISGTTVPIVEMRSKGILKTLKMTPLKPESFILSQIVVRFILSFFQISIFTILGFILGYIELGNIIPFILISLLGMMMILIFGFFFANFFNNIEVASGLLNALVVPLLMVSGTLLPIYILPDVVQKFIYIVPFTYLTDLYHSSLFGKEGEFSNFINIGVILSISLVFFYLTKKTFKWT